MLERHIGAWMHPEHGLGMHVFIPAQRDAPTNMINNAISVNAMHKLRIAQDLALFSLEVSEQLQGFDGQAHLEVWSKDPAWQPVRENVERLTAVRDWLEATLATNLLFEPLVGEFFRSSFVMGTGAANGDFVTPVIMGVAEHDFDRDLAYTRDLVGPLVDDRQQQRAQPWPARGVARCLGAAQSRRGAGSRAALVRAGAHAGNLRPGVRPGAGPCARHPRRPRAHAA